MKVLLKIIFIFLLFPIKTFAFENPKVKINNFFIQKYEVTLAEFSNFANKTNFKTEAEKQGFGYEYGVGWEKRKNWNYKTPYGKNPDSLTEPAVHVSYFEAEQYCKFINGRLPTFAEWSTAAYTQVLDSKVFDKNKTYSYPSGDKAEKMNSTDLLSYKKHYDVLKLPEGINGLVAMGGNVWEWTKDRKD
ncbi:MAG: formylglycine-generating enzyme family protein, partial [Candidatus Fonsibacter sp.]